MSSEHDTLLERYLRQQQLLNGTVLYADTVRQQDDIDVKLPPAVLNNVSVLATAVSEPAKSGAKQATENLEQFELSNDKESMAQLHWSESRSLNTLRERICTCRQCSLGATRNQFVFGVGNPKADIVVIGEAPGADEDAQGEPFVGRAGQLLTKILEAVQLSREEVFICNILKCRPPGNRVPTSEEVDQCEPYLYKQLDLIKPAFILALGLTAVNTLLKSKFKMADVRGKFFNYHDVRMMVTYHPAALLRNPEWKKGTWEDVQRLRKEYDNYLRNGSLPDFDRL